MLKIRIIRNVLKANLGNYFPLACEPNEISHPFKKRSFFISPTKFTGSWAIDHPCPKPELKTLQSPENMYSIGCMGY